MAKVDMKLEVTGCWWLAVRDSNNMSTGKKIKEIRGPKSGTPTQVHATKKENGWYFIDGIGWSSGSFLKVLEDNTLNPEPKPKKVKPKEKPKENKSEQTTEKYVNQVKAPALKMGDDMIKDMSGIWGAPFSFTETTDPPIFTNGLGYNFSKHIVNDMPLMTLSPGKPEYLKSLSDEQKEDIKQSLLDNDTGNLADILDGKSARYFEFFYDAESYYNYVNALCRGSAVFLGIGAKKYKSKKLKDFDWGSDYNPELEKLNINTMNNIPFFIDADGTDASESFSNNAGDSLLESKMGEISDLAKEFSFMFQNVSGQDIDEQLKKKYTDQLTDLNEMAGGNPNNIFTKLGTGIKTISSGGNLIFPQIWKSSSNSKNLNIKIKLASPYGDKMSIYLHVLVPFFHLVALSAPRSLGTNGVVAPFMIRAFCKGWFNCDMGMVQSMSFTKGENGWSKDGLPMDIEVTLSIKNLYETFSITSDKQPTVFVNNVTMIDFLATTSGIDVNKPELGRKIEAYKNIFTNAVESQFKSPWERMKQNITNQVYDKFRF